MINPLNVQPTNEEIEKRFQEALQSISDISLKDYVGKFLENNEVQIQRLTAQMVEFGRQIKLLQAEKLKMLELYRRVAKNE